MITPEAITLLSKELQIKKKPIPFPLETIKDIELIGKNYELENTKFLFYWLYLTGQRITEALKLKRKDVWFSTQEGKDFIVVSSITEKNKIQPRRVIPIPLFGEEKNMAEFVWQKIENLHATSPLFFAKNKEMTRTNAWNYLAKQQIEVPAIDPKTREIISYKMKIFPHYLRHCRASHVAMFYNYDIYRLMQFFGWSTPKTATVYATLNWKSLAEHFYK